MCFCLLKTYMQKVGIHKEWQVCYSLTKWQVCYSLTNWWINALEVWCHPPCIRLPLPLSFSLFLSPSLSLSLSLFLSRPHLIRLQMSVQIQHSAHIATAAWSKHDNPSLLDPIFIYMRKKGGKRQGDKEGGREGWHRQQQEEGEDETKWAMESDVGKMLTFKQRMVRCPSANVRSAECHTVWLWYVFMLCYRAVLDAKQLNREKIHSHQGPVPNTELL